MFLQQTSNTPSISVSHIWADITRLISSDKNKNKPQNETFLIDTKLDRKRTLQVNITSAFHWNQRDKLIFEMCLYQFQLQQKPDNFQVDLFQLEKDLKYNRRTSNRKYLIGRLQRLSTTKITIISEKNTLVFDFSVIRTYPNKVEIDFNKITAYGTTLTQLLSTISMTGNKEIQPQKKYVTPLKSEYALLMYDFMRRRVQQRTKASQKDNHPFNFCYRNFTLEDVLKYFNLWEQYQNAWILGDTKEQKRIKAIIAKALKELQHYADKNKDIYFPKYRLQDDMYCIKDFNYPVIKTDRELLEEIVKK